MFAELLKVMMTLFCSRGVNVLVMTRVLVRKHSAGENLQRVFINIEDTRQFVNVVLRFAGNQWKIKVVGIVNVVAEVRDG